MRTRRPNSNIAANLAPSASPIPCSTCYSGRVRAESLRRPPASLMRCRAISSAEALELPHPSTRASNSVSASAAVPCATSRSRGRSSLGKAFTCNACSPCGETRDVCYDGLGRIRGAQRNLPLATCGRPRTARVPFPSRRRHTCLAGGEIRQEVSTIRGVRSPKQLVRHSQSPVSAGSVH